MSTAQRTWWWLSFAVTGRYLGVSLVQASNLVEAIRESHRLGCNPGGEVLGVQVPLDAGLGDPHPRWVGRVLTLAEADEMSSEWTKEPLVSTLDYDVPDRDVVPESSNEGS